MAMLNNSEKYKKVALKILGYLPHLLFIPGWIWFIASFDRLMAVKMGWNSISGPLSYAETPLGPLSFAYALGYIVITIHVLSIALLIKAGGKPYWATGLHVLFAIFIFFIQFLIWSFAQNFYLPLSAMSWVS